MSPDGTERAARRASRRAKGSRPQASRALVHIGLNKSGSTTIQTWLAQNRDVLRGQGAHYEDFGTSGPQGFDHAQGFAAVPLTRLRARLPSAAVRAAVGIRRFEDQAARAAEFEARAERSFAEAGGTHVVSSEFIAAWLDRRPKIEALDAWLGGRFGRVDYVVYLRDQVDWLPSAFAQMIRTGGDRSMEEFIARHGRNNYHALVRRWTEAVGAGRLQVRLLERDFLRGGDLLEDFAALLGVDPGRTARPPRMNESLGAASLRALRRTNRLGRRLEGLGVANAGDMFRRLVIPFDRGPKLRLTPEQAARVAALNERGNEKLRQWLFPDRPRLFSGVPTRPSEPGPAGPADRPPPSSRPPDPFGAPHARPRR